MVELCFATGCLWRLIGKKDIFEMLSKLNIDGVELTYGKYYGERKIFEKDFKILKKFGFVSMHSPFKLSLDLMSRKEFDSTIKNIYKDYKKSNSQHIVFHPTIVLPKNLPKMSYVTENLNPKKGKNRPKLGFEKVLKQRKDWGLCLDASHAFDWGVNETDRIVKKWKKRIKSVHFSNNRYHKDHLSFEKVSKDFLKSIEPLKELNVPIIIKKILSLQMLEIGIKK
jgi:endonuclease IV